MSKGSETRKMILARAAPVFNQQGYVGSSLTDLMRATGLEKGGIYNHFSNKEQLALEAFEYSLSLLEQSMRQALLGKKHALDRLLALLKYFQGIIEDPPVEGGCPILNLAVEVDDTNPILRTRARQAMDKLQETLRRIIIRGIERQELRADIDIETWITTCIATMEGAIMLSKLYQDPAYIRRASSSMEASIKYTLVLPSPS
ncbi:TetR/AcrR family transcriptional regulator [Ktedonobacter racemifer]|uniref:Transcriptional regulator, TetR family n=1 Tax=Ktedonobacter racemifer DSM 44963 TaxID=485913 RepID=D6U4Q2_KTERA|nr:TetR/AcrR family transcriptional regulator [Ktedonobacter racemifer]EFH81482.1 transcriptional regulator, TetR family [Ktedonobacter racemifer DSM 44963]